MHYKNQKDESTNECEHAIEETLNELHKIKANKAKA